MNELMNINAELAKGEEIYLLIGEIPTDRMYIIEDSKSRNKLFGNDNKEKDIKSRFYFKSISQDGSFTMNSVDENSYQDHYYFGYSSDEMEKFNKSFIGLREFLSRARYVTRQFEPTTEYYVHTIYQGNAMRLSDLERLENTHDPRLLICILGDKALVKKNSILTSGFEFIDTKDTPFMNEKYYTFVSEKEDLPYTKDDICEGIREDIQQTISDNFGGPSFN